MVRGRPVGRGGGGRGQGRGNTPPVVAPASGDPCFSTRIPIPHFDPDNYNVWAFNMKSYMTAEGCYGAVDEASNGWAGANDEKKTTMRAQAFNIIRFSLGAAYQHISGEHDVTQAKELWDSLRAMHVQNDLDAKLKLESRLQALYWDHTRHHVDSFLADLTKIKAEYRVAGI